MELSKIDKDISHMIYNSRKEICDLERKQRNRFIYRYISIDEYWNYLIMIGMDYKTSFKLMSYKYNSIFASRFLKKKIKAREFIKVVM